MFTNIPLSFIAKGGKLMRPTLNEILWCYQTLLDADIISEISGLPTNALFLVFGIWALRLIALDQQNLIQGWVKVAGQGFGYLVIVAQVGSMFGLIPAVAFGPLFILGGVVLFPAFIIGLGQIIGSSTTEG